MEQKNETTNAVVLTEEQEALMKKVKSGTLLKEQEELTIFDLPVGIRKKVLLDYIATGYLCDAAELKIFDLPADERKEILLTYAAKYCFCDEADLKIFDLPQEERKEVLLASIAYGSVLCSEAEAKIFDLPKDARDEILAAYMAEDGVEALGDKARTLFDQLSEEEQEKILGE